MEIITAKKSNLFEEVLVDKEHKEQIFTNGFTFDMIHKAMGALMDEYDPGNEDALIFTVQDFDYTEFDARYPQTCMYWFEIKPGLTKVVVSALSDKGSHNQL